MFCSKVAVCSSEDLDCVESVKIDSKECIERCDGIIVDAINQNKPKDNSKIKQLLNEYENYKFPNKTDVPFPFSLNGKIVFILTIINNDYIPDYRFKNKLNFVKISFASSTFDVITKVYRTQFSINQ